MRSFGRLEQATAVMTLVVLGTCPLQADGAADDAAVWQRLDRTKDDQLDGNELDGGWVRFDTSGDKEVTKAEFMAGRAKERTKGTPSAEERFKQLDRSGNGYLSGNEIDETSRRYDVNKDNTVMLEEFVAGYTGQAPKPTTKAPHPAPPKQTPPAPPKQTPPAPPAAVAGGLPMGSYKCFGLVGGRTARAGHSSSSTAHVTATGAMDRVAATTSSTPRRRRSDSPADSSPIRTKSPPRRRSR